MRTAEHLAVLDVRRAAFRPRRDMVGIHLVEIAPFGIVARKQNRLAPERVGVVFQIGVHLFLDVVVLRVELVVLLALRAVDCRVQRSFHVYGYYSRLWPCIGVLILEC